MRSAGVRGVLVYCGDYKCAHSIAMNADQWPNDMRLSDLEPQFAAGRPLADPEKAARKLVEIANAVEPYMDQRVLIELINGPFLKAGGSPAEYRAGLDLAIAKGWLWRHESGTYVKFTPAGAELFA